MTPGFVDIHRHHDAKPLNDPRFGIVELAQGITTAVAGNCGISMTPRPENDQDAKAYYAFEEAVMGPIDLTGPKTYREYVRERGIYTFEEAIRRMTSQPAARMGLTGRGTLTEGSFADVLVFDPAQFRDNATFVSPANLATGLCYCIVNGEIAIDQGRRTQVNAGKCLVAK